MLSELPHRFVEVHELPDLVLHRKLEGSQIELDLVYVVRIKPEDYLVRKDSLASSRSLSPASESSTTFSPSYSRSDYHASPSSYTSLFPIRIAPYLTLLLNGAGWAPGYPKMMSEEGVKTAGNVINGMDENKRKGRFAVVGDISCDPYVSGDLRSFRVQFVLPIARDFILLYSLWKVNLTFCIGGP